mgnify:CR=1 FL=1
MVGAWLLEHPSKSNTWLLKSFIAHVGSTPTRMLDNETIESYAAKLRRTKLAPRTMRGKMNTVMNVLSWAEAKGWIDKIPRRPKLPRPVNNPRDVPLTDLAVVFEELKASKKRLRSDAVLRFILATGARPKEARLIEWKDINLERRVIVIPKHKVAGRTGKPRSLYLTDDALEILRDAPTAKKKKGFVFLSRRGTPYTTSGLRSVLVRLDEKTGVKVRPYMLRHTFAQNALDQTGIENVAKLLGHNDLQTVQVYAQVRDQRVTEVVAGLRGPLSRSTLPSPKRKARKGAKVSTRKRRGTSKRSVRKSAGGNAA